MKDKKMKKIDRTKRKILNALENDRSRILHIEITKSEYAKDKWKMRIGDIIGSTETSNIDIKTILKEIEDEMRCLR